MWYRLRRRLSCVVLSLSLCLSLSFVPATASASKTPETLQVPVAKLEQLENNLSKLQLIKDSLQQTCGKQKNQIIDLQTNLATAQQQLAAVQKQQIALQLQIQTLITNSKKQETSLQAANESLTAFAADQKRTRVRIKAQRNTWVAAAGILAAGLALK